MPKILLIRFSSIGDIVLASPVFRCIKQQLEGAELHFVTKTTFKVVTASNPYIDRFFYFDNNLDALILQLKLEQYDYVIDLHRNIRSKQIVRALKRKSYTIDKLSWQKFLLTEFSINFMPGRHITQRSLDTVAPLGVTDDGRGLDYFIPDNDKVYAQDLPTAHSAGFIAFVIGANHATKKMPVEKWQELCRLVQHPIVLLGGKTEMEEGSQIASVDPVKVYNACGKFNLNESADIVRQAKLVVSHDTGLQYIACALQKPVLAIWGGTSPKLDVEPYYGSRSTKTLHENICLNLSCQPCSKYGTATCPMDHFDCMQKLDMQQLAGKIQFRLLNSRS